MISWAVTTVRQGGQIPPNKREKIESNYGHVLKVIIIVIIIINNNNNNNNEGWKKEKRKKKNNYTKKDQLSGSYNILSN